jgi:cell fate regulator YaaT (PSP1 superfamily)
VPEVVGIRFKNCGKIYDFEINGVEAPEGARVVVESEFGLSIGNVVVGPRRLESQKELKKVLRVASEEDITQQADNEVFVRDARAFCVERIMARGLPMKLVCAEVTLDRKRIIFYFTAEGRIDFRELVKDLAAKFKTRIEMRQIGVRDKAKLVGGLGLCGKELCCRSFLTSFEPISIKMAKQQDLTLNTGKLSGICGRLMCCLGYEYYEGSDLASPPESKNKPLPLDREMEPPLTDEEESSSEIICCAMNSTSVEPAIRSDEKTAAQKKDGSGRKRRRRRRYRKRSKKSE